MKKNINPWAWVPTLYFAEGIPYVLVNTVSVIMFKKMGMSNGDVAMFTGLLYLPWVIKPLWSPFVDIIRTKRWWTVTMQLLMTAAMLLGAFTLPSLAPETIASGHAPVSPFIFTLVIFWVTAFASATHDIAADGYYMLALDQTQQSFFVGIRSTFYRLATIFGQGALVFIAGLMETSSGNIPFAWTMTLIICAVIFGAMSLYHTFILPRPASDCPRLSPDQYSGRAAGIFREFGRTFATFFMKKQIWLGIAFMLLYRLPEAFLVKMLNPFLLDPADQADREILVIHDHYICPVHKEIHPVPASQYIQEFRDAQSPHHTVLLVLQTAEPDLGHMDLILIHDPRLRQHLFRMSGIRHKNRRTGI